LQDLVFFNFKFFEFFFYIRIIVVSNIFAVVELRPSVVFPVRIFKEIVLFYRNVKVTSTTEFLL